MIHRQVNSVGNMNSITDEITNGLFYQWYAIFINEITDEMMSVKLFLFSALIPFVNPLMIILLAEWPTL